MSIHQKSKSLQSSNNQLADPAIQLEVLGQPVVSGIQSFAQRLDKPHLPVSPTILQMNIGKLCNQSCAHCHVDAGPDRKTEQMDRETMQACLDFAIKHQIKTIDITGGAPEMNEHFRWLVTTAVQHGIKVMHRCNLTILVSHERFRDLPAFFGENQVQVISSLPYFSKTRTDHQRGDGVFEDSIAALKLLNAEGYGKGDPHKTLDLVYNPSGAFLPGSQESLETEFKRQLKRRYDIDFDHLFVITNLPISRFLDYLITSGNYLAYMEELGRAFNPATLDGLMCRYTLSVGWTGRVYDCDFNQMLELPVDIPQPHIKNLDFEALMQRHIVVNQHCYGCTAGAGSSCGGEIT